MTSKTWGWNVSVSFCRMDSVTGKETAAAAPEEVILNVEGGNVGVLVFKIALCSNRNEKILGAVADPTFDSIG